MAMTRVPEEPSELKHAQHFYGNWRKPTFSHPNGLRIKYISYNSDELTKLYWELKKKCTHGKVKMLTLHNPLDISQVSVLAGDKLYVVPATRSDVPIRVGMSLAEYLTKRKAAIEKAEKENEGSETHIDFGAYMHKQRSQSSESGADTDSADACNQEAPKRQRKNKRPQTPLGDMDNSYHAAQAASAQGIDTSPPPGPVEAGPDDGINMNPFSSFNLNGGTDHE